MSQKAQYAQKALSEGPRVIMRPTFHASKKHKEIEQVDGSTPDTEENYAETYWEKDKLISTYLRYIYVIEDIQRSSLTIQEREN